MKVNRPALIRDEKPMTQETKDKLNAIAKLLAAEWATKPEIMKLFNISNERSARDHVSSIKKRVAVICTSRGKVNDMIAGILPNIEFDKACARGEVPGGDKWILKQEKYKQILATRGGQ